MNIYIYINVCIHIRRYVYNCNMPTGLGIVNLTRQTLRLSVKVVIQLNVTDVNVTDD